ncbi:hypothetical protein BASA50_005239 [Batrachochytrium salamandrivorans]|uniref:Uncharacterized protein n=1 Tax=Batrachochytrium salamandrivorans TaxID=1357716 RepID=A0ABQ8FD35_9FUNG|nr:hypothetical protein BASA60_009692 [Batrachochytrium salamandrivorans]KAH6596199.1 hypothetical protein BASA50_005239 [Batrachochytrium salamandrivorans]KAH9272063.1 hypothetical protein BASA83_005650 [Batrachochytrium salamandrivorans]
MAENTPSLADAHIVRTYPNDYAPSDTESEGEAQFEVEVEDEEQHSVSTRFEQNQLYMDRQITTTSGETSAWVLEPQTWKTTEGTDVVLIRKPTASNLSHRLLNPFIYRSIQNVGTLDDLAALLDTPGDWEVRYNQVVDDGHIIDRMNRFRNLPDDTLEGDIQSGFSGLVNLVAGDLRVRIDPKSETKIIVGGILARYQYDLRSKTDPHFLDTEGRNLIASEAKTHRTFPPGEMWYHSSRGIQVLSALYAFNCPTFLFTQKQWKLFVENRDRNAILTFPYNDNGDHTPHVNSSLVHPMGTTFLKAIVICLLSRRFSLEESMKAVTLDESAPQINETPQKTVVKPKYFNTPERPTRQSARLQTSSRLGSEKKTPSFVSGYANGQPVYTTVRVVPQDIVAGIEDDISMQEKKEYTQHSSEATLFE